MEDLHDSSTWHSEIPNTAMKAYVAFFVAKDVPFIDEWDIHMTYKFCGHPALGLNNNNHLYP
jgi:hypothetical protein